MADDSEYPVRSAGWGLLRLRGNRKRMERLKEEYDALFEKLDREAASRDEPPPVPVAPEPAVGGAEERLRSFTWSGMASPSSFTGARQRRNLSESLNEQWRSTEEAIQRLSSPGMEPAELDRIIDVLTGNPEISVPKLDPWRTSTQTTRIQKTFEEFYRAAVEVTRLGDEQNLPVPPRENRPQQGSDIDITK